MPTPEAVIATTTATPLIRVGLRTAKMMLTMIAMAFYRPATLRARWHVPTATPMGIKTVNVIETD